MGERASSTAYLKTSGKRLVSKVVPRMNKSASATWAR